MRRALITLHRWLGVVFSLLVLLWFLSGIGMMYWGYPEVTDRDRLSRGVDLDPRTINIDPTDIFAAVGLPGPPLDIRLSTYDGRPVFRYTDGEGETIWYADSGDQQVDVSPALMRRVAAAWAGQPADSAQTVDVTEADQWTLQVRFRDVGPLVKHSWATGDEVYVSSVTGEVVQHTTRASRVGAYLGPIPHWLYFTPLRKHGPEWSRVVIWTSAISTVTAMLGVIVGIWIYVPRRRNPYSGQKWWHMVLGLVVGITTVTWAFSGLLSMDPFPSFSGAAARRSEAATAIPRALQHAPAMAAFFGKSPRQALEELGSERARELILSTAGGEAVYLATLASGEVRVIPVRGAVSREVSRQALTDKVMRAAGEGGATIEQRDRYDTYYLDRHGDLPLPVFLVRLNDEAATRFYVDPRTAQVVGSYNSGRWVNRWLYHALHSWDLPWLYSYRPLWDIVVLTFMLAGTALAVTSVVLAWQVVGRKVSRLQA